MQSIESIRYLFASNEKKQKTSKRKQTNPFVIILPDTKSISFMLLTLYESITKLKDLVLCNLPPPTTRHSRQHPKHPWKEKSPWERSKFLSFSTFSHKIFKYKTDPVLASSATSSFSGYFFHFRSPWGLGLALPPLLGVWDPTAKSHVRRWSQDFGKSPKFLCFLFIHI